MVQDSNERQDFSDQYEWITTREGSLTLKSKSLGAEWMHSLHGAYAESQYIYGNALRLALKDFDRSKTFHILSMGLGLGYLEWIALFECVKAGQKFKIQSFELDPKLQDLFQAHVDLSLKLIASLDSLQKGSSEPNDVSFDPAIFNQDVFVKLDYQNKFNQKIENFKTGFLDFFFKDYDLDLIRKGLTQVACVHHNGPFGVAEIKKPSDKFNLIFYDAFSSKTQSELWSEDFLNCFLTEKSDENFCVVSTYAKVGALNRALKNNGFIQEKIKGFAYKEEATLAKRCQVPNPGNAALTQSE